MRLLPLSVAALALAVAATLGLAVGARPSAAAAQEDMRSTISVVGDGRVQTQPDVAYVSLGVDVTGASFAEAQSSASTKMQAAIDALVGLGISHDDIRTSRLSVSPVSDQRNNSVITGYRATNSVQVTLRDLDRVGSIVDAVTAAGANRVDSVTFAVENPEAPKNQARAQAMQNARTKADQLASLSGVRIVGTAHCPLPTAHCLPRYPERLAQPIQPQPDAPLHRADRHPDPRGDLGVAEAGHVGQLQRLALLDRQLDHRLGHLRRLDVQRCLERHVARIRQIERLVERLDRPPPPSPHHVDGTITDQRQQPGPRRATLWIVGVASPPGRQKRLLDYLFSLAHVA